MKETSVFDKVNDRIPESLRAILEVFANAVTVATPVVAFIGTATAVVAGVLSGEGWKSAISPLTIAVISVLFIVDISLIITKNNQKKRYRKLILEDRTILSKEYYRLLHDYRNTSNEIEYHLRKRETDDRTIELISTKTKAFTSSAVDSLSNILCMLSGEEISCCIKTITVQGKFTQVIDYPDACVETFVRSSNSNGERKSWDNRNNSEAKISENTDFKMIVSNKNQGQDSIFYQPDLLKYRAYLRSAGMDYENTTKNWEKYYLSAVVAPIRVANERYSWTKNNKSYFILGFLCADSLSTNAFPADEKGKLAYQNIIKAYAALLFNMLSDYQTALAQLREEKSR